MSSTRTQNINEKIQGLERQNVQAEEGEEETAAAVKIFQEWYKWG